MERTAPKSKKVQLTWKQQTRRGKRQKLTPRSVFFSSYCCLLEVLGVDWRNFPRLQSSIKKKNFLVIEKLQTILFLGLLTIFEYSQRIAENFVSDRLWSFSYYDLPLSLKLSKPQLLRPTTVSLSRLIQRKMNRFSHVEAIYRTIYSSLHTFICLQIPHTPWKIIQRKFEWERKFNVLFSIVRKISKNEKWLRYWHDYSFLL